MTFKRDLEQYRAADHGDLICDEPFPFVIEIKRYKTGCAATRVVGSGVRRSEVCRAAPDAGLQIQSSTMEVAHASRGGDARRAAAWLQHRCARVPSLTGATPSRWTRAPV